MSSKQNQRVEENNNNNQGYYKDDYIKQKNTPTTPLSLKDKKTTKQDNNILRDILLKYQVIEQDDSKFNFRYDDTNSNSNNNNNNNSNNNNHINNSIDSQKSSTYLSQYRKNMRNTDMMEQEDNINISNNNNNNNPIPHQNSQIRERGNNHFGRVVSTLFQTEKKKKQQLFFKDEQQNQNNLSNNKELNKMKSSNNSSNVSSNKSSIKKSNLNENSNNVSNNIWNSHQSGSKKRRNMNFSTSSSIDSSSLSMSADKSHSNHNNYSRFDGNKRLKKYPMTTTAINQIKKVKNTATVTQKLDSTIINHDKTIEQFNHNQISNQPLSGKSVYVDVYTNDGENISESFHPLLQRLGADVKKKFIHRVDLLIWKDGSVKNYEKGENYKIPILSIHWLEKCAQENRLVEFNDCYIVQKPTNMVSDLSNRVNKIYQKYVHLKQKEIKKKNIINHATEMNDEEIENDETLIQWQKTQNYQILQQKQMKDEIKCQDELESYYHDIIHECYQGQFTAKWKKQTVYEPLLSKYKMDSIDCIRQDNLNKGISNKNINLKSHTSIIPDTAEERILYVGMDSMKKAQKTMQDFFGIKKITPANNNNNNNFINSQTNVNNNKNVHSEKMIEEKQSQMQLPNNNNLQIQQSESQQNQNEMQQQQQECWSQSSSIQSSIIKQPNNNQQSGQKLTKQISFSQNQHNNSQNNKQNIISDFFSQKKVASSPSSSATSSALVSHKKKLMNTQINNLNSGNNLMKFGFSFKKIEKINQDNSMLDDQNNLEINKIKRIGYINLSQNQISSLQSCQEQQLINCEIGDEKDYFTEDIIIVGNNQLFNNTQQQNTKGMIKSTQSFNQLRILQALIHNKEIINVSWIEDMLSRKREIKPTSEYKEYTFGLNKNLFTGFTFSIYLDQIQRKVNNAMKQKSEIENVIHYFGGKVLENSKNASFIIFFKQYNKVPPGYDPTKCIFDKWIYDSVYNGNLIQQGQHKVF